jgi:hypothetical protein
MRGLRNREVNDHPEKPLRLLHLSHRSSNCKAKRQRYSQTKMPLALTCKASLVQISSRTGAKLLNCAIFGGEILIASEQKIRTLFICKPSKSRFRVLL